MTKWIHNWKKNNWTSSKGDLVKNKDDFEVLDQLCAGLDVKWVRNLVGIFFLSNFFYSSVMLLDIRELKAMNVLTGWLEKGPSYMFVNFYVFYDIRV